MAIVKHVVEVCGLSPVKTISHFPGRSRSSARATDDAVSVMQPIDNNILAVVMHLSLLYAWPAETRHSRPQCV